jgi:hypothetical protein
MKRIFPQLSASLIAATLFAASPLLPSKEFLTNKEIELIQDAQEIDKRIEVYLAAASLRLKTAEERLYGKESAEGDPLEFYTPEDMLDGYYRILRSVMFNLDEAFQKRGADPVKMRSALKELKKHAEQAVKDLGVLKKLAEKKQKEELWNLVNNAIDINSGAHDGAESGLARIPAPESDRKTKREDR